MKFRFKENDALSPLNHREFRFHILARFFYIMALRMVSTVVGYELFHVTGNSFAIGMAGLSEFVPVFCLALYAGHVIDRSDKRRIMVRCMLFNSICVLLLVLLSSRYAGGLMSARLHVSLFYVVIFFTGVVRAFAGPTSSAIVAQLIPRPILHFAANVSSSTFLVAAICGHASAGFFIAWFGVHHTFMIILGYVLLAALLMSRISPKPILNTVAGKKTLDSVREGLKFVFRHKILLGAISLDLFAVLFGGAVALIPEFASKVLQVGPIGFGWLNAAMDIGSFVMIILLTLFPLRRNQGHLLFFVVGGFGACIILFGLSPYYWLSFLALLVGGALDGVSVIIRGTILQLTTPDEMRGRVSSVNSMFINSSNELGMFESGFTARLFGGAVPAVLFGGSMTLLVVLVTWIKAPALRKFEY